MLREGRFILASGLGENNHDEESMDLFGSRNCVAEDVYVLSQETQS